MQQKKRDLKKLQQYLNFFEEDYNSRFDDSQQFWTLDSTECPTRRRVLLKRDLNGTNHENAVNEKSRENKKNNNKYYK
eukprot:UN08520